MFYKLLLVLCASFVFAGCGQLKKTSRAKKFDIHKKWVRSTLGFENYGFRTNHRMTPIVFEDLVIESNSIDGIVAYNKKSGHQKWRLKLNGGSELGAVLYGDRLFFGSSDGFVYAVEARTGRVAWTFPIRSEGLGRPTASQNKVYFISGNNVLYALNTENGRQEWVYTRRDSSNISVRGGSQPTVDGNSIYVGFSDGSVVSLSKDKGSVNWEKKLNYNKRFNDIDSKVLVDGDRLYVPSYDNFVYALNKKTGSVIWKSEGGGSTAVTLFADKILYSSSNGEIIVADKMSGKILLKKKVSSGIATQPQVYNGLIVYGESSGSLQVINADDGSSVGKYNTGRGIKSTPLIDQKTGDIYFITVNGDLYSMKLHWTSPLEAWPWE